MELGEGLALTVLLDLLLIAAILLWRAGFGPKPGQAEALAAQKIQEDARLATEHAKKDAPPNALLTGADGKPIPRVK